MAKVTRVFPYVNGRQTFTMPSGYDSKVTYHAWSGGGGAGGDSNDVPGGNGSAGTYVTGQVLINPGTTVEIFVGQGGQEGFTLQSNRKLFSMRLPGKDTSGVGPTGAWGYVNDPTQSIYPQYNSWPSPRTSTAWNSFMNQWAVSDIPQTAAGGQEEFTQSIYFPEEGAYEVKMAADNKMTVWFRDQFLAQVDNNFNGGIISKWINVPGPGTYDLRYLLINSPTTSNSNPAGAAIVIGKTQPSYMGDNGPNPVKGVIWSTRFGRSIDVSNQVPLYHAPLVPFYRPQRDDYDWSGFPDGKSMAFISATSTWTADELAKLNLSFNTVIPINYPVTIKGWGRVDQYISTGYYTFKRGQTWKLAQYSWSGNQRGTWETGSVYPNGVGTAPNLNIAGAIDHGSGTPSCWTEKQFTNDNAPNRKTYTEINPFANWTLPVPSGDEIFIVGFDDGQYFTSSNRRGTSDLQWQANSTQSQTFGGGAGGNSAVNITNLGLNYYGGYGGTVGNGGTSGGGGGGGGATVILQTLNGLTTSLAIAGGGAGGGGAGSSINGQNAHNEYQAAASYPRTTAAGAYGASGTTSGGGGGGGGGGRKGGKSGDRAVNGPASGGDGGWDGDSLVSPEILNLPTASFVMVGRGGDGGDGGGGGGAGSLMTGTTKLTTYQYIQVGGTNDNKFEGGASAIWYSDTDYITAGPGGRGGNPGSRYANNGNGQTGGCINADTNTNTWGGSGGGGGAKTSKSTTSGGPGKGWAKKPSGVNEYFNNGGNSAGGPAYGPGGGAGAGGSGQGGSSTKGGDGGDGKTVSLGSTGRNYTLGGGGGASAGYYAPGVQNIGLGKAGGGDGVTGSDPAIQWIAAGTYSFTVPRGVTSLNAQGIAGGGGGGSGASRGNGGGGSGGYLPTTAISVTPGEVVTVQVGSGGNSGQSGGVTRIQCVSATYTLTGGQPGSAYTGGVGGSPNGSQGEKGENGSSPDWYSGGGAGSPYGAGGQNANTNDKQARPTGGGIGAGGGGGWSNSVATVPGGLGGAGFVRFEWSGVDTRNAQNNTGSGGGGGYDGGGGQGGTGFVAIAYAGTPLLKAIVNGQEVAPIQQNGYTIHEFRSSGELLYPTLGPGSADVGSSIYPGGTGVSGYISGTAVGGVGNNDLNVFPSQASGYTGFLNDYGVWNLDLTSSEFNRTYYVYVPETASYDFEASVDNSAQVFVDDGMVLDMTPADRENGTYWYSNITRVTKKLVTGQHKIEIRATNIGAQGSFGMKIVKSGTSNPLLFNSRQPPIPSGSGTGGNGLVVLEFQGGEGTAQVKVNNSWKKLIGQWVRVDGVWKPITDSSVKVNGSWASLFGATPLSVNTDTTNFGGPPAPQTLKLEPQPQVVCALGFLIVKLAPWISSTQSILAP